MRKFQNISSDFKKAKLSGGGGGGGASSPLLFMLFVNDIVNNMNADLNMIFTINELKLFLILFADDQVVFVKSPQTLQSMLKDIENYCETWRLKINTSKTKAMIF